MENELNLSAVIGENSAPSNNIYRTESIFHEGMKKELAYHEAGHFVFDCIMTKYLKDFTPIKYAITCKDKVHISIEDGQWNVVSGVAPKGFSEIELKNPGKMKSFYTEDKKRIIARVFSTLAGVTTFYEFIEKTDYFVGLPDIGKKTVTYFDFTIAFYNKEYYFPDFQNIQIWLRYLEILPFKEYELVQSLLEGTKEIMSIQAVRDSIIFIHRRLIANECNKIEGLELAKLVKEVKRLTNKVPYITILEKYEQIVEQYEQACKANELYMNYIRRNRQI